MAGTQPLSTTLLSHTDAKGGAIILQYSFRLTPLSVAAACSALHCCRRLEKRTMCPQHRRVSFHVMSCHPILLQRPPYPISPPCSGCTSLDPSEQRYDQHPEYQPRPLARRRHHLRFCPHTKGDDCPRRLPAFASSRRIRLVSIKPPLQHRLGEGLILPYQASRPLLKWMQLSVMRDGFGRDLRVLYHPPDLSSWPAAAG